MFVEQICLQMKHEELPYMSRKNTIFEVTITVNIENALLMNCQSGMKGLIHKYEKHWHKSYKRLTVDYENDKLAVPTSFLQEFIFLIFSGKFLCHNKWKNYDNVCIRKL